MEGLKYRKTGWLAALGSAALLLGATEGRAEWMHGAVQVPEAVCDLPGAGVPKQAIVGFVAHGSAPQPRVSNARENWQAVAAGMRNEWEALQRAAVEATVTMFFIRGGTTPNTPPADPGGNAQPPGQSNAPPGNNPPPPGGNGETPPGDPGDPPTGTPEPASFLMALLGAGLAAGCGWRRRRA